MIKKLHDDECGQTLIESYIILAGLVIVVLIILAGFVGQMDIIQTLLPNALGM